MRSSDPHQYVVPSGFIELTRAVDETVSKLFGAEYVTEMTEIEMREEAWKIAHDKVNSRSHKRVVAQDMILGAMRGGRLGSYLYENGNPAPLDQSHWQEWVPSWRPFAVHSLGKIDEPTYLLKREQFERWLSKEYNSRRYAAKGTAAAELECKKWLEALATQGTVQGIDAGGVKHTKETRWAEAEKEFQGLRRRAFDRAWAEVAATHGDMSTAGRKPKTPH